MKKKGLLELKAKFDDSPLVEIKTNNPGEIDRCFRDIKRKLGMK